MGADPVLDERAKAAFKSRLDDLAWEIDDADAASNTERAETLHSERDPLIRELAAAAVVDGWGVPSLVAPCPSSRIYVRSRLIMRLGSLREIILGGTLRGRMVLASVSLGQAQLA